MTTLSTLRRRFLLLTFARWLGPGLVVPVLVLVFTDAGLSLGQVGVVFAFYGATTALLEVPTGGLADALGRRPVLAVGAVLFVLFDVIVLSATSLPLFLVGAVVGGMGRALSSGPLEAWFVDEARRINPALELRADLGRAGVLEGSALLVGALTSVLVTNLADGVSLAGLSVTTAPIAVAAIADALLVVATVVFIDETGHRRVTMSAALGDAPQVVRSAIATARSRLVVRRLLIVFFVLAFGFVSIEVLWQPRLAELLGSPDDAALVAGLIVAAFALAATVGAGLASGVPKRWVDQPQHGATVAVLLAIIGFVLMAATNNVWWFVAGMVLAYTANGASGVFLSERLHDEIVDEQRATMLSVRSMTAQIANVGASLTLAPLAQVTSIGVALIVGGGIMVLAVPILLTLPRTAPASTENQPQTAYPVDVGDVTESSPRQAGPS